MVAAGGFFGIYQGLIAISRGGVPLFCACNVACQAGEARARAAALRRRAATLQAVAAGSAGRHRDLYAPHLDDW